MKFQSILIKRIKGKIEVLKKLTSKIKKYILALLDLEARLEVLQKLQMKVKSTKAVPLIGVFSLETQEIYFLCTYRQYTDWLRKMPEKIVEKTKAFWVDITTSEVIGTID